jgi:hypothetical protein
MASVLNEIFREDAKIFSNEWFFDTEIGERRARGRKKARLGGVGVGGGSTGVAAER